jgi:hypothetical protein
MHSGVATVWHALNSGSSLGCGAHALAVARVVTTDHSLIVLPTQGFLRLSSVAVSIKGIGWSDDLLGTVSP